MNDLKTEIAALDKSVGFILDLKDNSPELHISHIALMRGGQLILEAIQENGTPRLRNAISTYAQNGGAGVVEEAIRNLFPDGGGNLLTDEQIGELADFVVENYKP